MKNFYWLEETDALKVEKHRSDYLRTSLYHLGEWLLGIDRQRQFGGSGCFTAELVLFNKRLRKYVCSAEFVYCKVVRQLSADEIEIIFFDKFDYEIAVVSIDKHNKLIYIDFSFQDQKE